MLLCIFFVTRCFQFTVCYTVLQMSKWLTITKTFVSKKNFCGIYLYCLRLLGQLIIVSNFLLSHYCILQKLIVNDLNSNKLLTNWKRRRKEVYWIMRLALRVLCYWRVVGGGKKGLPWVTILPPLPLILHAHTYQLQSNSRQQ